MVIGLKTTSGISLKDVVHHAFSIHQNNHAGFRLFVEFVFGNSLKFVAHHIRSWGNYL
jgi:hypothetical protein